MAWHECCKREWNGKREKEKSDHSHPLLLVQFLLLHNLSFVSVVFDFNASLNDFAPLYPMQLSVNLMRMEKSELLIDVIVVLFLLSSLHRLSSVSVVFDFNASLNDFAPLSRMLFPVYLMRIGRVDF